MAAVVETVHEEHMSSNGHHEVFHQFEDLEQQNESYIVGMWVFLVTEVMFFGGLFLAYSVYRWMYPGVFFDAHRELNLKLGFINTTVLLTSSLFMALAVHYAQLRNRKLQLFFLGLVLACALCFLVIKGFEYSEKFQHHHFPGATFHWDGPKPEQAQLFFGLYFVMTGLHGIHVILGVIVMAILMVMIAMRHRHVRSHVTLEMAGLYWHFVDIVWIFLFPLFYLIPH
jgi:cytochrome c oxidase subunit III